MVIMKLKYIKDVTLATAILFAMPSCDSFLDTTPEDLRSPEQIFSTYSSTENAMFGVYNYLRNVYPWNMPDTYSTSDNDVGTTKVRIKSDKQKNVAKLLADRRFRKMA